MMQKLDKRENDGDKLVEPNEGELALLSSNKGVIGSPSLDLEESNRLAQLAEILVEGYVDMYERNRDNN